MGRAKGTPKTGGRKAGTPNKTTTDIKTWVANILDGGRADFEKRLKKTRMTGSIYAEWKPSKKQE